MIPNVVSDKGVKMGSHYDELVERIDRRRSSYPAESRRSAIYESLRELTDAELRERVTDPGLNRQQMIAVLVEQLAWRSGEGKPFPLATEILERGGRCV